MRFDKKRKFSGLISLLCTIAIVASFIAPFVFQANSVDVFAASENELLMMTQEAGQTTDLNQSRVTVSAAEPSAAFEQNHTKAGEPLTVTISNAPEDLECTYQYVYE